MQEYTVTLANGQSYTIRATSAAQAARIANEDAQESGSSVANVTEAGSNQPITTRTATGTLDDSGNMIYESGPERSFGIRPTLSDDDDNKKFVDLAGEAAALRAAEQEAREAAEREAAAAAAAAMNSGSGMGGVPLVNQPGSDRMTGSYSMMPEINPIPELTLGDLDPQAAFQRQMGLTSRPLTDPYRQYLEGSSFGTFYNPFRFGNVLRGGGFADDLETAAPGYEDYLATVRNPLQARQNAADIFNQIVSGVGGNTFSPGSAPSLFQDVLGIRAKTNPYNMVKDQDEKLLSGFGLLGQQALKNRIGSAAFSLIGSQLPSVENLYRDYYGRSQAGEDVAPTFAQALQGAYGLGG